ncbi:MAG: ABC transporter permease [Clostridia bacterium]|nr:ABC transporter permease [Clostridia bacterium]
MRKYLSVFKTSFKQESKTLANSLVSVVSFAVIIYIFNELWGYIYGGSGIGQTINGYTFEMMIWYMIAAEILMYAYNRRAVTNAFGNDIKSGKIAYQLNKPYNYYGYQVANQCGSFIWKLCFLFPAGTLMGLILLGPIPNFKLYYIFPIMFSIIIACVLACMIFGMIGLLCFWLEEASPFTWILEKFVMLLGLFFPPEFFPAWLQPFITYSPIYPLMSGPSKLLADFSWELFAKVSAIQAIYMAISLAIGLLIYKSGTKKVNVHGG